MDKLSRCPNETEWEELYAICQQQAVAGVTFLALEKLSKQGQRPPQDILFDWIGLSEDIKQQNRVVNQTAVMLCDELEKDGFECCILKGQGNAMMYPDTLSRTPGDIDVWVRSGKGPEGYP